MSTHRMLPTVFAAGAVLLALVHGFQLTGLIAPLALAGEGVWGRELANPPFLYRLGAEMRLTPSPECDAYNQSWPAVAYNYKNKEYLVVWENTQLGGKNDIYARRVTEGGALLSWFCVTTGANNRRRPALAYNATNDEYLIV